MTYYMTLEALEDLKQKRNEAMVKAFEEVGKLQTRAGYYVGKVDTLNHIIANTLTVDSEVLNSVHKH